MTSAFDNAGSGEVPVRHQSDQEEVITSAISWGAIVAGAVAATAATVILLVLGTGVWSFNCLTVVWCGRVCCNCWRFGGDLVGGRTRAAQLSIATALSMVIGAFIASAAAALGGMIRDEY